MGTKTNPGKYDCLSKLEPDEPYFVLMARDPLAARLVDLWASLSHGTPAGARQFFDELLKIAMPEQLQPAAKVAEAYRCAASMEAWLDARPTQAGDGSGVPSAANANPKLESTATPNAADAAES